MSLLREEEGFLALRALDFAADVRAAGLATAFEGGTGVPVTTLLCANLLHTNKVSNKEKPIMAKALAVANKRPHPVTPPGS